MEGFFHRLFSIHRGETKNALLFAGLAFVSALAVICGETIAEALFLLHVGASELPRAYMVTALGTMAMSSVLLYVYHHFSADRVFLMVMLLGAAFYTVALCCLVTGIGTNGPWLWFALRAVGYMLVVNLLTSFWSFSDQYHPLQDAKRLYGLFSCAIFLGMATTGGIIHLGVLDINSIYLIVVFLFLVSAWGITYIAKTVTPVLDDSHIEGSVVRENISVMTLIKAVMSSRMAMALLISNLVCQLLLWITEFNYMSAFEKHFVASDSIVAGKETAEGLTLFLGQCTGIVGIFNVFLSLFVYGRLVKRFGVNNLEVITPIALILMFVGWPFSSTLFFPMMGYLIVEGLNFVIDDNNFTLLLNAVPTKVKYKFRVVVESFFEPLGMFLVAATLSVLGDNSRWLGLGLAALSLILAFTIRSNYAKGIISNLAENTIRFGRKTASWLSTMPEKEQHEAKHHLLTTLGQRDETSQMLACKALLAFNDNAVISKMLQQLSTLNADVKVRFVELITDSSFATNTEVLDHLQSWMHDEQHPELVGAIALYLAKHRLLHPDKAQHYLHGANIALRGAAIIALQTSGSQQSPTTVAHYRTIAAQHLQDLLGSTDEQEIRMGTTILGVEASPQNVDILIPLLKHGSTTVVRDAAQSIAQIINIHATSQQWGRYVPLLIAQLTLSSDHKTRLWVLKSLGKIGDTSVVSDIITTTTHFSPSERRYTADIIEKMGLRTVPTLLMLIKDRSCHPRCRLIAGTILRKLSPPQLRVNLSKILQVEIAQAYFYCYHSHRIQEQHPEYDLALLEDTLKAGFHASIDFVVEMLGTAGSTENNELLSTALRSPNAKVRSQAVESVEKSCPPKTFRQIEPLITDAPLQETLNAYLQQGRSPLKLSELLDVMEQSPMLTDNIMAATLKRRFNLPQWRRSLRRQMRTSHETFHRFAYELLES